MARDRQWSATNVISLSADMRNSLLLLLMLGMASCREDQALPTTDESCSYLYTTTPGEYVIERAFVEQ